MDVYACDHTKELIIKAHNNDKSAMLMNMRGTKSSPILQLQAPMQSWNSSM